ncbi:hypothetical protein [Microbacterium rhizosphaerae]|uniref:Uncharacterized protein n=1 Tax=Microbacterium rhizosphaerae TaxID=1678237 RepID=A0ABZ0SJK4_9MICO|nr:hypothetical protein [Microbacterium rhizosphaerae]WPR88386.1 hypothetical protein SM116_11415 [Microbacterium rhizosphaerae]
MASQFLLVARSRAGNAARYGTPAEQERARADLAEARIADAIEKVVNSAPPLRPEQRERLASLLRTAAPNASAA